MNLGTANSAIGNDLPQQYRFTTVQNLQTQLNALSKKLRNKQVLYNDGALVGPVCGCFVFGIDYNNGNLYYRDENNEWVLKTVGAGGGMFDAIVDFSVNANPNTVGTTFSPNSPALTTVLYVSTIDSSQWTYNGTNYVTYVAPFWTLRGNTGTTPGTDFIGTIDNKDLVFKVNNIKSGVISSNFNTSFGTNSLNLITSGTANVAMGGYALYNTTSGIGNVGLGYFAGGHNTTGSNQIFINAINRVNYVGDQTLSPIYIQQNTTITSQLQRYNGLIGINTFPTYTHDIQALATDNACRVRGVSGGGLIFGAFPGSSFNGAIWASNVTPDNTNYSFVTDGSSLTSLNGGTNIFLSTAGVQRVIINLTGVGIGTTPNTCAKLDVNSTTQGLLLPRMTQAQRNAIVSPVAGLAIYQTNATPGLRVFNGTNWTRFTETID